MGNNETREASAGNAGKAGRADNADSAEPNQFEAVKARLEEIAREVEDDSISLDEALDLYEEAVKLGLKASDLLEVGISVEDEPAEAAEAPEAPGAQPPASASPQAGDGPTAADTAADTAAADTAAAAASTQPSQD